MDSIPQRASVIGAGTMGPGIAQCLADRGLRVKLYGLDDDELDRAMQRIAANHQLLMEMWLLEPAAAQQAEALVERTTSLEDAASDVDLLFEAAPENFELKCGLLEQLGRLCPPSTVLATNTSGLSITALGDASGRPQHVAGCHWVNPPQLVPLVEVISGRQTAPAVIEMLMGLMRFLGKRPIHVRQDVPGFVLNRLQFALLREALHLVENGIASAADVDQAVTAGLGMRYAVAGPLHTADLGGLDLFTTIASYLWPQLSNADAPSMALTQHIDHGELGAKTGRGFYEYDQQTTAPWTRERDQFLLRLGALRQELSGNLEASV